MKPKLSENEQNQLELGKFRLVDFLNMKHELVRLSDATNWEEFCKKFGEKFHNKKDRPGLPVRLMVGLTYLKYLYNLSDEAMMARVIRDVKRKKANPEGKLLGSLKLATGVSTKEIYVDKGQKFHHPEGKLVFMRSFVRRKGVPDLEILRFFLKSNLIIVLFIRDEFPFL